ncbi:hypothetical protein RhiirA4_474666 [Rhizophagus irregularis]|uniref:Uncharacterized protein n=1 Tax=Rhizophagus irregularis TaxID=588596 RepID=A0A2I1H8V6_9GLOM|nr:hypothetical protein RhiirA4_474666 [Rhizophagus irregularis]
MASSSKKSIENQEDSESSYYVEEEEIDEAKNVVEESLSEVPITPISSTNSSGKGGKIRQLITDDKSGNITPSKKDKDFLMELKLFTAHYRIIPNLSKLRLKRFVQHCLYFHVQHIINGEDKTRYSVDVLEKVKSDNINNIMKDLPVHSLSGLDLANNVFL